MLILQGEEFLDSNRHLSGRLPQAARGSGGSRNLHKTALLEVL
ncbi:hypothetical protein BRYFOR_05034 [Marvinbryantia formatexigens DSM 14469]|uniref:Uncharacterized protein n=1 Tax=Marvinbryantia formatexigens DSM 14469 TaxID=478749 RepID=C6L8U5_9FIRM|nr:hypothetical protein [Marvinbryantia formatexigens]EET62684.1 hypothetical protein BRYFOR_05034 [Marvinbryantia formatexigens DSM 14469]